MSKDNTSRGNTQASLPWLLVAAMLSAPALAEHGMDDDPLLTKVQLDQLEVRNGGDDHVAVLEGQAWIGYDLNKFWMKADIERDDGHTHEAEVQALYSRAISPYWDFQAGVRKDFKPAPDRSWGVIGFQGVAPYEFEVETALFIGEGGRTALRLSAEYEVLLTQRLILTPEFEVNFYGQNDEDVGVGSGLSDTEAGLRLRYEFRREFAPYIGVNWTRKYGNTADFARAERQDTNDWQWVIGIRAWF